MREPEEKKAPIGLPLRDITMDQFIDIEDGWSAQEERVRPSRVLQCANAAWPRTAVLRSTKGMGGSLPTQKAAYAPLNASYGTSPKNKAKTGAPRRSLRGAI
jgi:hypothetical protein